jgi:hypothetical protein
MSRSTISQPSHSIPSLQARRIGRPAPPAARGGYGGGARRQKTIAKQSYAARRLHKCSKQAAQSAPIQTMCGSEASILLCVRRAGAGPRPRGIDSVTYLFEHLT